MDVDGLTFAVATTAEERVAKRLGLTTVRVGVGVANGVPEGKLVSFGLAGSLGELRIGDVLDATRVVDETGATLWEGPGLGVRGARTGAVLGDDPRRVEHRAEREPVVEPAGKSERDEPAFRKSAPGPDPDERRLPDLAAGALLRPRGTGEDHPDSVQARLLTVSFRLPVASYAAAGSKPQWIAQCSQRSSLPGPYDSHSMPSISDS